ncbi:MAG: TonB-dependent receptor [Azonexaceae bacterium]|uniref:TonB-dependent siderophore receptor n=1 Tax=Azonexus sp. R2A61 TaxID=2744443 RepID=UPI001F23ED5A|nr:TonB-dependent receptor [Azonexus sp. R2A61]MCE1238589.1 TonB-dependent receptor [Azonexaceae bacterium]
MTQPFPSRPRRIALTLRAAMLGLTLAGPALLLASPPAYAQNAPLRSYQIPAGPLGSALTAFAAAADITLSFEAEQTRGLRTPGLNGDFTPAAGLARLLAGSGLEAVHRGQGNYVLRASQTSGSSSGETTLAAMQVTANQLGEITEGSGSYTPGTIATATRLVLTPRETPQTISVITRQEMDDFNLTSIDAVMAHTPGISIVTLDSERTAYYARGFPINNFQYDGIPMTRNASYSAGNTLSDMAIYDRVEVLKGATGLLTGSGDPGATINLIRKKPTKNFQGEISLGAGTNDNYRGQLDLGGALNPAGSLRGRAVAAYQDRHSHLDGYERQTATFYGILEADLGPATLLTVGVDAQNNDPKRSTWGGIPIYDANGNFNQMPRSFNNGADWSSWKQYTRTAFATLEHTLANDWVLKAQFNHQINGYDATLGSAGSGNPDPATGGGVTTWEGKYVGKTVADAIDLYASGPFELLGRKHELVLGASHAKRVWTNRSYWAGSNNIADYYHWNGQLPEPDWDNAGWQGSDRETIRESGAYTAARFNLRDDLKLIAGGRVLNYENATMKKSGVIVPYLGAVYDLNDRYSLYASYTSIYQPQSAQDAQGKTLDPLEGINYETGIKGSFFNGRLNASLAYFRLEQDNYAEASGGLTPSGGTAYRAIDGVRTRGFEAEISGQLTPQWQIHAGFNHKIARQQGEKVATMSPENQFTLSSSVKPAILPGLTLGGGARWQSKAWADVGHPIQGTVKHTMASYWLLDAMASYQIDKHLSVNLKVSNLLDKKYYTLFDWYSTYTWGEPRNVMLTMKYRF